MLRFCCLVSVFLFFECLAHAQLDVDIKIKGTVLSSGGSVAPNAPGSTVHLVGYKEGGGYLSSRVGPDGAFTFTVTLHEPTFYELKYRDYKLEVLLCPDEPEFKVRIIADSQDIKSMKVIDSRQYDAYRAYKHIDKNFKDKLPGWLANCRGKGKECLKQLKKETDDFNGSLEYLRQAYKGTFIAEVVAPMDEMPTINTSKPAIEQLREHFFDNTDFGDVKIYTTSDIENNLSLYIEYIADTSAGGRINFINTLYNKTRNNHNGQKELLNLFLANFIDKYREDYLWSLSHWAEGRADLSTEQPVMASKLKIIAKTVPGANAPEVSGTDRNGQEQKLSSIIKKNKLTLLVFWSSDCPHCRATLPELAKIYGQYHDKGLEIFAASIEQEKEKWEKYLADKKFGWMNVLLAPLDPSPTDYFLQYTPTIALINQDGVILHRFISVPGFEKSIGEILGK